ncbi:MAG: Ig-like domain-containing protein [Oscillospiraceae bacterium]|jgi:uncharacterized protein YkwD/uncharacterized protein YjdB|nr:Ig-like domain-containing protein [Oscillospiraceae bacterium]
MNVKIKRLISTALLSALLLSIAPPGAHFSAASAPSSWAVPEINEANTEGLLTPNAQKDFQRNLTRSEFCELVVALIERTLGQELPLPAANPFTDTSNIDVQKASLYGGSTPVVNGVGNGLFAPDKSVARQEIITMMIRALNRLSTDTGKNLLPSQPVASLPFGDSSKIADYAVNSVKTAYANGMIKGNNLGNFNPLAQITSEECVAVVRRSNNSSQTIINAGLTNEQLADKTVRDMNIGFAYGDTADGVSQSILLPATGAGGAAITWSSANPNAVSASGTVSTVGAPQTATLTATVRIGTATRTRQFTLKTTSSTGDNRLLENAYRELEILFLNQGDTLSSVTGRVFLPDTVLGADVTWTSSLPSTVNAGTGAVTIPSNGSQSVTLTATIAYNGKYVTKTFVLSVTDPSSVKQVSLHGVELGMTLSQTQSVLGTARDSFKLSTTETWYVFHTNYNSFIAVCIRSNGVAAIYSMASSWATQLKNKTTGAVITPEQADAMTGVGGRAYTDSAVSGGTRYAVLIYDETSGVTAARVFDSGPAEQFIFQTINAFRYLKGYSVLAWNAKLGASARAHTADMGTNNYLSETGRSGSTFATRALAQGYESALVASGAVTGGGANAFDILDGYIGVATNRAKLLSTSLTVVGVGFGSGYSGANSTLGTVVFGTLIGITGVTSTPSAVAVNVNGSAVVTLTVSPSNRNETFTVASSNTYYFTVTANTGSASTVTATLTGVAQGSANITVTGSSSGNVYSIPVSIGTVYASSVTISNEKTTVVSNQTTPVANAGNYVLGKGNTYKFTAYTNTSSSYATDAAVTWSSSAPSVATVSSTGLVTGLNNGTAAITARIQRSASASDYITVTMSFTVVTLSFSGTGMSNNILSLNISSSNASAVITPTVAGASLPSGTTLQYYGTSSNSGIVTVASAYASTVSVTGVASGQAAINVTAIATGLTGDAKVTGSFTATVTGQSQYPTGFTLSTTELTVYAGDPTPKYITVTTNPPNVANKTMVIDAAESTSGYGSIASITLDSTNNRIAIAGNATGTVSIRVYMKGQNIDDRINPQTFSVTVAPAEVTGIMINGGAESVTIDNNQAVTLTCQLVPSYATTPVTIIWSSNNPAAATVDTNGVVTPVGNGQAIITAAINNTYITDTIGVSVTFLGPQT